MTLPNSRTLFLVVFWAVVLTVTIDVGSSLSSSSSDDVSNPTCGTDACDPPTDDSHNEKNNDRPLRVVVIGAGPSGMSFCHALEIKRRQLLEEGDTEGLARLPHVTVYESAATHGGLWNSDRTQSTTSISSNTSMYEGLWINSPKERNEFWDYTFEDHFGIGVPLPAYMPRQAMLEYMTARVTRHAPDFFERYVTFRTKVDRVTFDDQDNVFRVQTTNLLTGTNTTTEFDKCVWAAGEFAKPKIPQGLLDVFRDGGFDGRIIHSSESTSFKEDVELKRILIIGGAWSAEDLALTAIKLGVSEVYISYRSRNAPVSWPETWPGDKVELLPHQVPQAVIDGPMGKKCIMFAEVDPETYQLVEGWDNKPMTTICDIQTVVFATGFSANYDMLDESVFGSGVKEWEAWRDEDLSDYYAIPDDWKMPENEYSSVVGDVKPSLDLFDMYGSTFPYLFLHCIHISNPSLVLIVTQGFSSQSLFATDVFGWFIVGYLMGDVAVPEPHEMRQRNQERILDHMRNPNYRAFLDVNYGNALAKAGLRQYDTDNVEQQEEFFLDMEYRNFAEILDAGKHPVSLGSYWTLNENAREMKKMTMNGRDYALETDPGKEWKTFRDKDSYDFKSIYTGVIPHPFKKPWLEIDDLGDVRSLV